MTDKDFLKMALEEGRKSQGPHKFGALVVKDQEVLAMDHNRTREISDPTAHAEISAIKQVCANQKVYNLPPGCTLYAGHEPCIMCFCCAAWAQIERIVFANPASNEDGSTYEFKDLNIFELNQRLIKPLEVELVKL